MTHIATHREDAQFSAPSRHPQRTMHQRRPSNCPGIPALQSVLHRQYFGQYTNPLCDVSYKSHETELTTVIGKGNQKENSLRSDYCITGTLAGSENAKYNPQFAQQI